MGTEGLAWAGRLGSSCAIGGKPKLKLIIVYNKFVIPFMTKYIPYLLVACVGY